MTQTQTSTSAPRGWGALISTLNAAPDQQTFHRGMLDLQCKIVAAEYGALWVRQEGGEVRLAEAWPQSLAENAEKSAVIELITEAAKGGFERQTSHVLKIEAEGANDPAGIGAHVFVTIMRVGGQTAAVTTVVADCRDPQVIQTTAPLRELAGGLFDVFYARQEAARFKTDAVNVRSAMALLSSSQDAPGYPGACLNLVNDLARQLNCSRVSMGWIKGHSVKLVAMSDTEQLKRHSENAALIELAMAEALDQQQPIVYPFSPESEPLLLEAIVHSHRKLAQNTSAASILSVPLRQKDDWLGVITLERAEEPFDPDLIQHLQLIADVLSPHLQDRRDSDRWLTGHAWQSVRRTAGYLVGPKHVAWKLLGLLLGTLLMVSIFVKVPYKVTAKFVIEAQTKRIISAPYQGRIDDVLVREGEAVTKGQILAQLDAWDLTLQLNEAMAEKGAINAQLDEAIGTAGETAAVRRLELELKAIKTSIDLLEYHIDKATIRSPIDGTVIDGDWRDKIGGVVNLGDIMFQVADLTDLIARLRIKESDIDQIHQYVVEHGKLPKGTLATRTEPNEKFPFDVEQIVPMAVPEEGSNVFEARTSRLLQQDTEWLRPGMEGVARVEVDKRILAWIATHAVVDFFRLWVWW